MADRRDLDFTYSLTDWIIRLSLGELPDFSGAKFDGGFSLTLEQAQGRKPDYVAEQVGIGPGRRLLDLGCGWGPLLAYTRARGGNAVGVTLSSAQMAACRQKGVEGYLEDAREIERERFGTFDAVASLGAFEHFCSPGDYAAGHQEDIYRDLFVRVSSLLAPGGRFYLQTMVFGRNMIPASRIDLERLRAVPPSVKKMLLKLQLLPRWLISPDFRLAFTSGVSANQACFERELLDHYRLIFENTEVSPRSKI